MTPEQLKKVLEKHQKWLLNEAGGECANLSSANLSSANLRGAYLRGAYLRGADLSSANLYGANLSSANLSSANLRGAYLRGVYLRGADLSSADLYGANLSSANLSSADLSGANLSAFFLCPEEGDFVAWKKASGGVVLKLLVTGKRVSIPTSRKCRTDRAKVLAAFGPDKTEILEGTFPSKHDARFVYEIGKEVTCELNEDIREECTSGIHFFMTRKEAEEW